MSESDIFDAYEEEIIRTATEYLKAHGSYSELCAYLYSRPFFFILPRDEDREDDGLSLRLRIMDYVTYGKRGMALAYSEPCNVLEMMLALAQRAEDDIIFTANKDHVGELLYDMISSMGIAWLTDDYYSEVAAQSAVDNMLNRRYEPNGHGGLFTVKKTSKDMRDMEIWYQMQAYLNEKY